MKNQIGASFLDKLRQKTRLVAKIKTVRAQMPTSSIQDVIAETKRQIEEEG
jgi:hypothetical protein